jgi:hypothetical protein
MLRRGMNALTVRICALADNFSGGSHDNGIGRDNAPFRNKASGRNQTAMANDRAIEDCRSHADHDIGFHRRTMNDRRVSNGNVVTDDAWNALIGMDQRKILNVGSRTDLDLLGITSNNRVEPNTRISIDFHVSEDADALRDEYRFVNLFRVKLVVKLHRLYGIERLTSGLENRFSIWGEFVASGLPAMKHCVLCFDSKG